MLAHSQFREWTVRNKRAVRIIKGFIRDGALFVFEKPTKARIVYVALLGGCPKENYEEA